MIGDLDSYKKQVTKCSHCSLCEAVCPVYLDDMLETHVARARVDLINETLYKRTMPVTPRVREIINRCQSAPVARRAAERPFPYTRSSFSARAALYDSEKHSLMQILQRRFTEMMMEKRGFKGLPAFMLAAAQALAPCTGGLSQDQPAQL